MYLTILLNICLSKVSIKYLRYWYIKNRDAKETNLNYSNYLKIKKKYEQIRLKELLKLIYFKVSM